VYFHDLSGATAFESNPPAFDVAVCGYGSLLIQVTVSPTLTVSSAAVLLLVALSSGVTLSFAEHSLIEAE
jgi:hypothetical protein